MSEQSDPSTDQPNGRKSYPPPKPRKLPRYTQDDLRCEEDGFGRKFYYTPEGRAVCGRLKKAKNRKIENEACCAIPTAYGPCRVHGAGGGPPLKAGGRYSRVLNRWKRSFDRALADDQMLDTRYEVALMDSLIEKLVKRVEQGDSPSWRADMKETFDQLERAVKQRRQRDVGDLLRKLSVLINDGAQLDQITKDLNTELERRAKRAEKIAEMRIRRSEKLTMKELEAIVTIWSAKLADLLPSYEQPKILQAYQLMAREVEFLHERLEFFPGQDLDSAMGGLTARDTP